MFALVLSLMIFSTGGQTLEVRFIVPGLSLEQCEAMSEASFAQSKPTINGMANSECVENGKPA